MPEKNTAGDEPTAKRRASSRVWLWFLFGFLFVFVGVTLFCPMAYFNGRETIQLHLWQYYLANIRDVQSAQTSWPRSGNLMTSVLVFAIHIMGSTFAGIVALLAVAMVRRRSRNA